MTHTLAKIKSRNRSGAQPNRSLMAEMGRRGGKIGGKRCLETMSDDERRRRAYQAARKRWDTPCAYCGKRKLDCRCRKGWRPEKEAR
jgi:hypothetical protein